MIQNKNTIAQGGLAEQFAGLPDSTTARTWTCKRGSCGNSLKRVVGQPQVNTSTRESAVPRTPVPS